MTEPERQAIFNAARDVLFKALPDAWAIYVYGSFARGDEWPGSDVDFGVLLPPRHEIGNKLGLMGDVSAAVGNRDVDVVDLRRAGLDLITEVLRDGRTLHLANAAATLAWEGERMSDYADFRPRRADIVNRYLREPLKSEA